MYHTGRANLYVQLGSYIVGYLSCIIQCCPAWQIVSCMTDCDCCVSRQLINVDYYYYYSMQAYIVAARIIRTLRKGHRQDTGIKK